MEFTRSGSAKKTISIGNPLIQNHQFVLDHLLKIGFHNSKFNVKDKISGIEKRFNGRLLGHYTIDSKFIIIFILNNDTKQIKTYFYHLIYSESFKKNIWTKCLFMDGNPKVMVNAFIKWADSQFENIGQKYLKIELL